MTRYFTDAWLRTALRMLCAALSFIAIVYVTHTFFNFVREEAWEDELVERQVIIDDYGNGPSQKLWDILGDETLATAECACNKTAMAGVDLRVHVKIDCSKVQIRTEPPFMQLPAVEHYCKDLYDELGGLRSKLSIEVLPRTLEALHFIILKQLAVESAAAIYGRLAEAGRSKNGSSQDCCTVHLLLEDKAEEISEQHPFNIMWLLHSLFMRLLQEHLQVSKAPADLTHDFLSTASNHTSGLHIDSFELDGSIIPKMTKPTFESVASACQPSVCTVVQHLHKWEAPGSEAPPNEPVSWP